MSIEISGSQVTILHPETFVSVTVRVQTSSSFGCHLLAQVFIPKTYRTTETILGLLGTPNGNRSDDWRAPDGTVLPPASAQDMILMPAYQYCVDNWCVQDIGDSIFVHASEESFEEINECDKDYVGDIEQALENLPEGVTAVCGENIFCLVDGVCGRLDDAMNALVNNEFVEASQTEAEQCSMGYEGDLCDECAPGYYSTPDGRCTSEQVPTTPIPTTKVPTTEPTTLSPTTRPTTKAPSNPPSSKPTNSKSSKAL